jgi:subtilisin family serine protease
VRWFNAVSVEATGRQVDALAALPFVDRLDVVRRYRRLPEGDRGREPETGASSTAAGPEDLPWKTRLGTSSAALDYGIAENQVRQLNVPAVHALGLHGEGVVVAMFDTGFNTLSHQSLAQAQIAATRDFVNGDADVADGGRGDGSHGTQTLSVIGGFQSGRLIGPAFAATFLLAKTEDTTSETPVEEDNWAAATEWAEARGADVISSSLGYLTFDAPHRSYTPADMNGQTAVSTRAADAAAARGVVVVNSAGNSGFNASANTLGAPADGRLVIAVGAVDAAGNRVSFSSVGPSADGRVKPDVVAQGAAVIAATPRTGSGYAPVNGTSFSCPLTAGVVALMLQARPSATVQQVEDALRRTASRANNPDNLTGHGIVNAIAAVQAITR